MSTVIKQSPHTVAAVEYNLLHTIYAVGGATYINVYAVKSLYVRSHFDTDRTTAVYNVHSARPLAAY